MDDIEQAIEAYRKKKALEREKLNPKKTYEHDETESRNIHLRLSRRKDADIIKWIEEHRPISKEIRSLVRALIAKEVNESGKERA